MEDTPAGSSTRHLQDSALRISGVPGHPGVHRAPVAENAAAAMARSAILDAGERERAERFRHIRDRERHVVAHVALRLVLADRLGVSPAGLSFGHEPCAGCGGPHGKPYAIGHPVHFSLSHVGDHVLIAVAGKPVGVDIEAVPAPGLVRDVARELHATERDELTVLPEALRPTAFARCWARKEACLKAVGTGLAHGAAEPYVGSGDSAVSPAGLRLVDLPFAPGHAAAMATVTG